MGRLSRYRNTDLRGRRPINPTRQHLTVPPQNPSLARSRRKPSLLKSRRGGIPGITLSDASGMGTGIDIAGSITNDPERPSQFVREWLPGSARPITRRIRVAAIERTCSVCFLGKYRCKTRQSIGSSSIVNLAMQQLLAARPSPVACARDHCGDRRTVRLTNGHKKNYSGNVPIRDRPEADGT